MTTSSIAATPANTLSLFGEPFVLHGLLAGTAVALLCGLVGWFVVLRGQVFAGDALSHVSYTGAVAALAAGVDLRFGLIVTTVTVGAVLGLLGGRRIADDVVIGTTFAWVLGLGVLCVSIYNASGRGAGGSGAGADGASTVSVLFGSIFGISTAVTVSTIVVSVGLLAVLGVVARPLLFASVDPTVAAARGVPVRLLGTGFLMIVGVTAAEITQVVGAILLLGLLAAPAAAATRLTPRPWRAAALSMAIAVVSVWGGITVSVFVPTVPASSGIIGLAAVAYAGAALADRSRSGRPVGDT